MGLRSKDILSVLEDKTRDYQDKIALGTKDVYGWKEFTYKGIGQLSRKVARYIIEELDVPKGERLAILSELTPDKIALSIAAGDHKALTKANGVGPKLAQRICMELKDKVGKAFAGVDTSVDLTAVSSTLTNSNAAEAVAALEMLGYSQSDASVAVSKIDNNLSVEDIIKQALKMLALG